MTAQPSEVGKTAENLIPTSHAGKTAENPIPTSDAGKTAENPIPTSAVGQTEESTAPAVVRPARLTPGGSSLAALLTQNRAKAGRSDLGDGSGPVPRPRRTTPSGGTFDLLDITAVGEAIGDKKADGADAKVGAQSGGGMRVSRLTPASGGLPALLAAAGRGAGSAGGGDVKITVPEPARETSATSEVRASNDTGSGRMVADGAVASVGGEATDSEPTKVGGATPDASGGVKRDSAAPRPTRLTPASGGLAALLAQTRSRTGKHDTIEKKGTAAVDSSESGPAFMALRSGEAAVGAPSDGAPSAVVAASVPEEKKRTFAATLMGVPAPEIPRPLEVFGQPAPSGKSTGADQVGRDESGGASAPHAAGDHEPTQKNLEVWYAADGSAANDGGGSSQRFRTTELVDTVRKSRRPQLIAGALAAAGLLTLAIVLMQPRHRKPDGHESRVAPGAVPAGSSPSAAEPAAPVPAAAPALSDPSATPTPAPGAAPAVVGEEVGKEGSAKDEAGDQARQAAESAEAAKAAEAKAKADERDKARAEAQAAKAAKAEAKTLAAAEAKATKAAKVEAAKVAAAEAKAARAAKAEAAKVAAAEAKAAQAAKAEAKKVAAAEVKAAKAEAKKQAVAEAKGAKAAKTEAEKQEAAEPARTVSVKTEAAKVAAAEGKAAKAAKAEAKKQALAEAKAAKAAKAEAQKQARAEARAARAAKAEAQATKEPGLPWDGSSATYEPRADLRRPASLSDTPKSKSKSTAAPRLMEDPDATLPLSTR